ncbi:MAG TPA: hypothetical protein VNX46_05785 [Candidatus Acidoferrum sp.]|nr:hypothetical protein [Candidatus Acidoferrum sp.]
MISNHETETPPLPRAALSSAAQTQFKYETANGKVNIMAYTGDGDARASPNAQNP